MSNPHKTKEVLFKDLNRMLSEVNSKDNLIILEDFIAWVRVSYFSWPNVLDTMEQESAAPTDWCYY